MIEASISFSLENGEFIICDDNCKLLFKYKDVPVYLQGNKETISNSTNIIIYTGPFYNNKESLENIKQIFNNIFMKFIQKSMSINYENGNFSNYERDCLEIYKIITIRELDPRKPPKLVGKVIRKGRGYDLSFNNIREYKFTKEISDAILLKVYSNLVFWNNHIPNYMHNSNNRACLEKLIPKDELKSDEVLEMIDMAILFLKERYSDNVTCDELVKVFENLKHKSKNQKINELINRTINNEEKLSDYKELIKLNKINRGYESHEFTTKKIETIWIDHIFYEIIKNISIKNM